MITKLSLKVLKPLFSRGKKVREVGTWGLGFGDGEKNQRIGFSGEGEAVIEIGDWV